MMFKSNQTKILLIVVGILALIWFVNNYSSSNPYHNDGELTYKTKQTSDAPILNVSKQLSSDTLNDIPLDLDALGDNPALINHVSNILPENDKLKDKFKIKNRAKGGYKRMNYEQGTRGNGPSEFDDFFDENNKLTVTAHVQNDEFLPNDETGGNLATYKSGMKKKQTDEDVFKSDDYLPQQTNKDWFDIMPEAISVKNRHLINVTRAVGINTVGTSHKNGSYDLRGNPPCPKFVVSPWMQSSIEPDLNIKGLCN
jgi:hypothetical protein